eukprot:TRINITY_DN8693_c0_g1_i1.p1 TRINITY_DN8693_c0_g1~~TRINITY_DN8693_c0_g1_i1.p1  ORF type:complete len:544 (-),score=164.89 TRINITY_DN8693_c0_g1_i1:963-2594(-)
MTSLGSAGPGSPTGGGEDQFEESKVSSSRPSFDFGSLDNAKFSKSHMKAILVAGSGFLVDSYDNFIIGLLVPMIAFEYFGKNALPNAVADGWLKAASSWGNIVGQAGFAVLGDAFGRKRMYGIELIILIIGALLCAFASWPIGMDTSAVTLLTIWRFILGIGVGGDYPVSAVMTSEFASSSRRGQMIATVFGMQGFGILLGSVASLIVLTLFKEKILEDSKNVGYVWRILAGFGAVPALIAVYFRWTIAESPRFVAHVLGDVKRAENSTNNFLGQKQKHKVSVDEADKPTIANERVSFQVYWDTLKAHFRQRKHMKVLVGCATAYFWMNISYFGSALNLGLILGFVGYGSSSSTGNLKIYEELFNRSVGMVLINLIGTFPGYWFTAYFVDKWGRKPIQYMGFSILAAIYQIMAIFFQTLKATPVGQKVFVILYTLAQFFFNFGPNTTTFITPAEAFPTALRSSGHGFCAAFAKVGAVISAQGFSLLTSTKAGFSGVLYVFSASCVGGILSTLWVPETKGRTLEAISPTSMTMDTSVVGNSIRE